MDVRICMGMGVLTRRPLTIANWRSWELSGFFGPNTMQMLTSHALNQSIHTRLPFFRSPKPGGNRLRAKGILWAKETETGKEIFGGDTECFSFSVFLHKDEATDVNKPGILLYGSFDVNLIAKGDFDFHLIAGNRELEEWLQFIQLKRHHAMKPWLSEPLQNAGWCTFHF